MQIVEISEPEEAQEEKQLALGIDFGTTNSLIAISDNFQVKIIKAEADSDLVKSIIGFNQDKILIGEAAVNTKYKIRSIKRLLAKSYSEVLASNNLLDSNLSILDDQSIPKVNFAGGYKTLPAIASELFKYLKQKAEKELGIELLKVVVSVPAYFADTARGQIILAANLADLEVIRLISEPTAAAYAYGLSKLAKGSYLIYDLGGGTFDISILNMQQGVFQVIATGGDSMLGGDDIDYDIAKYIANKYEITLSAELIQTAKKVKEDFVEKEKIRIILTGLEVTIDRAEYDMIISTIIDKTINIAQEVHYEADNIDLDGIILVGGSTRIVQIEQKLRASFGVRIYNDIDPDKIVVAGAAMQAENLTTRSDSLLIDVVPLSLGLELHGGIIEKIIMRNTPIPFSITKEYTTHTDNQNAMKFHVVQGEREMARDCRSLANFELSGINPSKAGKARVKVIFSLDADNILSVSASDVDTGVSHNIEINPTYGVDREGINQVLESAYKNAADDHKLRLLIEAKESANSLIKDIGSALKETPDILNDSEYNKILVSINSLQNVINIDNRDQILFKMDKLNQLAASFIQKHLDKGADLFLKNQHIDKIKLN